MSGIGPNCLGKILEPQPGSPNERDVFPNPAAMRGPYGKFHLFPRLVGRGNDSLSGLARVKFNDAGDFCGVERLDITRETEAECERRPDGRGGCEDTCNKYAERIRRYWMTCTGHSPIGPRFALALSEGLFHCKRLGLATFEPYQGIEFVDLDDKDACVFPNAIPNRCGKLRMPILHRPLFRGTRPEVVERKAVPHVVHHDPASIIRLSYWSPASEGTEAGRRSRVRNDR